MTRRLTAGSGVFALLAPLASCSGGEVSGSELADDGEIAAVVSAAHEAQVQHGQVALLRAQTDSTRGLAWAFVKEHSLVRAKQDELLTGQGIELRASGLSEQLESEAGAVLEDLQAAPVETFDVVYLEGQLEAHQETIALFEDRLIPYAQNEPLRQELLSSRDALGVELQQIEEVLTLLVEPDNNGEAVGGTSGIGNSESGIGGPGWASSPNGAARPITAAESTGGTSGIGNSESGIGGPGWASSPNGAARPITTAESTGGTSGIGNSQSGIGGPGWATEPRGAEEGPRW